MKIELTRDPPILLKIVPETPLDVFKNGVLYDRMKRMGLSCLKPGLPEDGVITINMDDRWNDFTEHGGERLEKGA